LVQVKNISLAKDVIHLGRANSFALAHSFAASNLLSELFGNAALSSGTSMTIVIVVTFHPTPFAGCVFWQFLAFKAQSMNVSIAFAIRFASLWSDERTLVVLVATVQRLALLVIVGIMVARSLKFFEFWCILRRAEFHHAVADPARFVSASRDSSSTITETGWITSQNALSHHGASLLDRIHSLFGKDRSNKGNSNNEELHIDCDKAAKSTKKNKLKSNKNIKT